MFADLGMFLSVVWNLIVESNFSEPSASSFVLTFGFSACLSPWWKKSLLSAYPQPIPVLLSWQSSAPWDRITLSQGFGSRWSCFSGRHYFLDFSKYLLIMVGHEPTFRYFLAAVHHYRYLAIWDILIDSFGGICTTRPSFIYWTIMADKREILPN